MGERKREERETRRRYTNRNCGRVFDFRAPRAFWDTRTCSRYTKCLSNQREKQTLSCYVYIYIQIRMYLWLRNRVKQNASAVGERWYVWRKKRNIGTSRPKNMSWFLCIRCFFFSSKCKRVLKFFGFLDYISIW